MAWCVFDDPILRFAQDFPDFRDAQSAGAVRSSADIAQIAQWVGCDPARECFMRQEREGWRVSFEAGPYQWAIVASEALAQLGIFAEPHYSFDLCFYPE
jgi:hypothetical protein